MLSDFLTLELYFGSEASALYFEELAHKYGPKRVLEALSAGDVHSRRLLLGPDAGRFIYWLSEQGRGKARQEVAL